MNLLKRMGIITAEGKSKNRRVEIRLTRSK